MRILRALVLSMVLVFLLQGWMTYDKNKTGTGSLLLSQSELEQLFSHNKTYVTNLQGVDVEVTCISDGTQTLVSRDSNVNMEDSGTYTIRDGKKCDLWKKTYGAVEKCLKYNFVSRGKYYLVNIDGSFHAYITIQ